MAPINVSKLSVADLLDAYDEILVELREREITRSSNNPVGDYAEWLFCKAFGWERTGKSAAGHDARDKAGLRYEIKARRLTPWNESRQLGAIRNLDKKPFDVLAAVLFDQKFRVFRAALIPYARVTDIAARVDHTNSWRVLLDDSVWKLRGVTDPTDCLKNAESGMASAPKRRSSA